MRHKYCKKNGLAKFVFGGGAMVPLTAQLNFRLTRGGGGG